MSDTSKSKPARRSLTTYEKECAARAKALWQAKKEREKTSQEKAAAQMGWTQGALSGYLNGRTPLNLKAIVILCKLFQCTIEQIDPDFKIATGDSEAYVEGISLNNPTANKSHAIDRNLLILSMLKAEDYLRKQSDDSDCAQHEFIEIAKSSSIFYEQFLAMEINAKKELKKLGIL